MLGAVYEPWKAEVQGKFIRRELQILYKFFYYEHHTRVSWCSQEGCVRNKMKVRVSSFERSLKMRLQNKRKQQDDQNRRNDH